MNYKNYLNRSNAALALLTLMLGISWLVSPEILTTRFIVCTGHSIPWAHASYSFLGLLAIGLVIGCFSDIPKVFWIAFLLFLMSALLSSLFAVDRCKSLVTTAGFIFKGWAPAALTGLLIANRDLRRLLHVIMACAFIVAVIGLGQYFTHQSIYPSVYYLKSQASGTFGHYLPMSSVMLIGVGITLSLRNAWPRLHLFLLFTMLSTLVLTLARSTLLITTIIISYGCLASQAVRKSVTHLFFLFGCAIVLGVTIGEICAPIKTWYIPWTHFAVQRVVRVIHSGTYQPVDHRRAAYVTTFAMVKSYPLTGVGLGGFPKIYSAYRSPGSSAKIPSPDNVYLRIFGETGVVGGILFLVGLMGVLACSWKHIKEETDPNRYIQRLCLLGTCAGLSLQGLFFDTLYWNAILIPFSILLTLAGCSWKDTKMTDFEINT